MGLKLNSFALLLKTLRAAKVLITFAEAQGALYFGTTEQLLRRIAELRALRQYRRKKPIGSAFHELRSSPGLDIFNVVPYGPLITFSEYGEIERIRRKKS